MSACLTKKNHEFLKEYLLEPFNWKQWRTMMRMLKKINIKYIPLFLLIKISAGQNVWKLTNDISIFSGVKSVRFQDLLTSGIIWQFFKTTILAGDEIFQLYIYVYKSIWPSFPAKHNIVGGGGDRMTLSVQVARSLD